MKVFVMFGTLLLATNLAGSAGDESCPLHAQHMKEAAQSQSSSVVAIGDAKHGAEVDSRHDTLTASHDTTRHSFKLFADGGAIELRANDPADSESIEAVRTHLHEITAQFVAADFSTPAFVHGRPPAGVAAMERLHKDIAFQYQTVDRGGRIRMKTKNPDALAAIHDFLKFQVIEHRTGDTGKVVVDK